MHFSSTSLATPRFKPHSSAKRHHHHFTRPLSAAAVPVLTPRRALLAKHRHLLLHPCVCSFQRGGLRAKASQNNSAGSSAVVGPAKRAPKGHTLPKRPEASLCVHTPGRARHDGRLPLHRATSEPQAQLRGRRQSRRRRQGASRVREAAGGWVAPPHQHLF